MKHYKIKSTYASESLRAHQMSFFLILVIYQYLFLTTTGICFNSMEKDFKGVIPVSQQLKPQDKKIKVGEINFKGIFKVTIDTCKREQRNNFKIMSNSNESYLPCHNYLQNSLGLGNAKG